MALPYDIEDKAKDLATSISQSDIRDVLASINNSLLSLERRLSLDDVKSSLKDVLDVQKMTLSALNMLASSQNKIIDLLTAVSQCTVNSSNTQSQIEKNLASASQSIKELVEAQKASEARIATNEANIRELIEAQKRTEKRVEELVEAQKASEARIAKLEKAIAELTEAQKRTEQRIEELVEAQRKTQTVLDSLLKDVDEIKEQVGGIAMVVGYGLEDKLYPYIPQYALKVYNLKVTEYRLREYAEYNNGKSDEMNIFVKGEIDGVPHLLIGECKAQIGKKDVNWFMQMIERVSFYYGIKVLPFIVGFNIHPEVRRYIQSQYPELRYHLSYEMEHGIY